MVHFIPNRTGNIYIGTVTKIRLFTINRIFNTSSDAFDSTVSRCSVSAFVTNFFPSNGTILTLGVVCDSFNFL